MQTLAAGVEKVWHALFGGLGRGDPAAWLVIILMIIAAALLVVRRPRG
jgi:hypothetical protein